MEGSTLLSMFILACSFALIQAVLKIGILRAQAVHFMAVIAFRLWPS